MKTFGAYLTSLGVVAEVDVAQAAEQAVLLGGRIGTAIIDAGLISLDEMERHLAAYHELEPIPADWLRRPDAAAQTLLPRRLAIEHSAFPLYSEKRALHVGLVDPHDHATIDELSFACSTRIVPYALTECRFAQLMQDTFGVTPSVRLAHVIARTSVEAALEPRADDDDFTLDEVTRAGGDGATVTAATSAPRAEPTLDGDLLDEATFEALNQNVGAGASENPLGDGDSGTGTEPFRTGAAEAAHDPNADSDWSLSEELPPPRPESEDAEDATETAPTVRRPTPAEVSKLERVIRTTPRREDVIGSAIRIASAHAEFAALFVLRGDIASGTLAWRDGDVVDIESILCPAGGDSVFASASETKRLARAEPEGQLDVQLATRLGRAHARELTAFPITVGNRVVNLLLVDTGDETIAEPSLAALARLCDVVARAYERLIRARKELETR